MVKRILDRLFKKLYGDEYNEAAVKKITGQSDKVNQLIRQYKNERYPNIAITVDLLTTGIDVPKICHLVFFRRVPSRILYEQLLGRATRRCDEIGKTVFKIYDPVDIYATLQYISSMKPLLKDPNVTTEQLLQELTAPSSFDAPGSKPDISLLLDQCGYSEAKLQSAWRNQTNQDVAASIIGYIHQAALGGALIPFEQRVSNAMQKIYNRHNWRTFWTP